MHKTVGQSDSADVLMAAQPHQIAVQQRASLCFVCRPPAVHGRSAQRRAGRLWFWLLGMPGSLLPLRPSLHSSLRPACPAFLSAVL